MNVNLFKFPVYSKQWCISVQKWEKALGIWHKCWFSRKFSIFSHSEASNLRILTFGVFEFKFFTKTSSKCKRGAAHKTLYAALLPLDFETSQNLLTSSTQKRQNCWNLTNSPWIFINPTSLLLKNKNFKIRNTFYRQFSCSALLLENIFSIISLIIQLCFGSNSLLGSINSILKLFFFLSSSCPISLQKRTWIMLLNIS